MYELQKTLAKWRFPANKDVLELIAEQGNNMIPNFIGSLDADFKWLIPKVYKHFIDLERKTLIAESSSHQTHEWAKIELTKFLKKWIEGLIYTSSSWEVFNDEPSRALSLAVGRLVAGYKE